MSDSSLITPQEAEEVVSVSSGIAKQLQAPLMIILGILIVVVATLLVLLLLSLLGSQTGWRAILPFLESKPLENLQIN